MNLITILSSSLEKVADVAEAVGDKFIKDICPDFLKPVVGEVPTYQIEAAAHSACHFFGMDDIPLREGDSIGVYTNNPDIINDDVFQYNIEQFKKMDLTSFEDQTKVWTHECGHRITQKAFGETTWADELGADYFVGVREEILGLGKSNFEKTLGVTKPSPSHPGVVIRLKAIEYGRQVVAEMKRNGIVPDWENCLQEFAKSDFAKMSYETHKNISFVADTDTLHPQINKELKGFTQADVDWYEHQARITSGSEQAHWIKEAKWAKDHLRSFCPNEVYSNVPDDVSDLGFKGYTQADVEWYEHQARITSGSEQAHWIKEAKWARDHIKSFMPPSPEDANSAGPFVRW